MKLIFKSKATIFLFTILSALSFEVAQARILFLLEHVAKKPPEQLIALHQELIDIYGIPESFIVQRATDQCQAAKETLMHLCFDDENKGTWLFKREDVLRRSLILFKDLQQEKLMTEIDIKKAPSLQEVPEVQVVGPLVKQTRSSQTKGALSTVEVQ